MQLVRERKEKLDQVISEATLEIEGQDKPAYVAETIMVAFP